MQKSEDAKVRRCENPLMGQSEDAKVRECENRKIWRCVQTGNTVLAELLTQQKQLQIGSKAACNLKHQSSVQSDQQA